MVCCFLCQAVVRPLRAAVNVNNESSQAAACASRRLVLAAPFMTSTVVAFSASADDLKTAESGMQYVDLVEGSGPSPVKGARIK